MFIRELISNASDSLEKLRYLQLTGTEQKEKDTPLEIHIGVDDEKKTFIIQVNEIYAARACSYISIHISAEKLV